MDPDHRLVEEVLYLHSLWHRGPPPTFHNHSAATEFASTSAAPPAITGTSLRPAASASFKRKKKKKKRSAVSDIPWPVPPSPPPLQNGGSWPEFPPPPLPTAAVVAVDSPTAAASLTQHAAVAACRNFFKKENISDNDDDEDEDEDEEAEAFKFFVKLFEEASELKCYYEKNWENGQFYCFVCVATSVKTWKKFPGCVSLVQHASSITKTKRTKAHRAFAKVICRLLAWDIQRLPSIVLDMGGTLSQSLAKSSIEQGDTDEEGSPPPPVVI